MPIYSYTCLVCGKVTDEYRKMSNYSNKGVCVCGHPTVFDFENTVKDQRISVFKPYVENNAGPKPIRFESKEQRDRFLAKKGLTYDQGINLKPRQDDWENDTHFHGELLEKAKIATERVKVHGIPELAAKEAISGQTA